MTDIEQWRQVVGYEGLYEVSDLGQVRSTDRIIACSDGVRSYRSKLLKPYSRRKHYLHVMLSWSGHQVTRDIHCLVAEAWIGAKPFAKAEVCHENGNKHDNRASNLRWDTRKGNKQDAIVLGEVSRGSARHNSKLVESDIPLILELAKQGFTQKAIGERFGVGQYAIWRILKRNGWRHAHRNESRAA